MSTEAGLDHPRTVAVHLFSPERNLYGLRGCKQIPQLKLIIYRLKNTGSVFRSGTTRRPTYSKSQKQEKDSTDDLCRGKTVQKQSWLQKEIIWDTWPQV